MKKDFNKDFLNSLIEEGAWKKLSEDFGWTEALLDKFKDKVDWKEISGNRQINWTASMLDKFARFIDWHALSGSLQPSLFSAEMLEKYSDRWDWHELSGNTEIRLDDEILTRFADKWDWSEIICRRWNDDFIKGKAFLEKYIDYITASDLCSSGLWESILEEKEEELKTLIFSTN